MVNDIKKLDDVIGVLEEQSHHMKELNGVLGALNEAKEAIEKSNTAIGRLSEKQEALVSENSRKFEDFNSKLSQLERQLIVAGRSQNECQKEILELNRQLGDLKETQGDIQKDVSDLEFLTPEVFHSGRMATETKLAETLDGLHVTISEIATRQQSKAKSLQVTTILGLLLLAGGVGYSIYLTM
jgi:chromosome segregation ATPase